jgi:hypothetical protein
VRVAGDTRRAHVDEPGHEVTTSSLLLLLALSAPQTSSPSVDALIARASEYVRRFEHDFEQIVSDEHYEQQASGSKYGRKVKRETDGEMLFWWVPDAAAWLSVRNVKSLDGRPVVEADADRFRRAFTDSGDPLTHLRHLRDESARYNIGTIFRNVNYPTMALQFLEPQKVERFTFRSTGSEAIDGVRTEKIAYQEHRTPTIVQDEHGTNMFAQGTLWIAPDGTVMRTNLHIDVPFAPLSMDVTVDYHRDAKLGIQVPTRMREHYVQRDIPANRARSHVTEQIDCTATYARFRRFETSGRILR